MMLKEDDVVARVTGVTHVRLKRWVSRGWLCPANSDHGHSYSELDVARCDMIRQFRDDLEIDSETLPVVLSLLDQVYGLRRELRVVMRAVDGQPDDVRRQIAKTLEDNRRVHDATESE